MLKDKQRLSGLEQKIYFTLHNASNRLFTLDLIRRYGFCSNPVLNEMLSDMAKKGWLFRLKRGMYYVKDNPRDGVDPLLVAPHMFNGYLAFATALRVYGAISEVPYVVYVATTKSSKSSAMENMELKAVSIGRRAFGEGTYRGYVVSSKAKTLYDCFYLPEYAGGYSRVLEAVHGLGLGWNEWKEFLRYIDMFESSSFKRKTGYLLELVNSVDKVVPKQVIGALRVSGKTVKLGNGGKGTYAREWGVMDYLGREYLLGWSG